MIAGQGASPDPPAAGALQLSLEYAPSAIAILDTQMRYVAVSRRFAADLRVATHNLVGQCHYDVFPEIPERWREVHRRCLGGAVERCQDDPFHRADGTVDWVSWEVRPWHDAGGTIGGIVIFGEVVTARVEAQTAVDEALRQGEAELRAMFDLAPLGMTQADARTGRLSRVNRRLGEMLGYEAQELCALTVDDLTHPDDRQRSTAIRDPALCGEESEYQSERRLIRKDGSAVWVNARTTVIRDGAGSAQKLFSTIEDITERRATQQDLELYRSALQAADNGIVITDTAGKVLRANRAVTRLTGYEEAELVGKTLGVLQSGRQSTEFYRALWGTIKAGRVWRGELVNRRKDGASYHEDQTITPVRSPAGEITHYIAIKQDVTERKRTEEALAEAQEQQRLALAAADLGTWSHDVVARRMHFDERAMTHLGLDRADLTTEEFLERLPPEERVSVLASMQDLHDGQGAGRRAAEHRVVLPSGEVRWLLVNVCVRFEGEGAGRRPVSSVVTSRDITEAKRAEQRQRDTEEQLRAVQKMEAIGRLAGGVAHDFNNLLSVILSYSEAVMADLPPPNALRSDLEQVIRAAKRADGLTSQLLSFSRHQVWRPQSVDLSVLLQNTSKMLRRLIGENIDLDVQFEQDLFRTRADPGQLEQVLMNLAVNARDAMPDGGRLAIRTANANVDPTRAALLQVEPGDFVELTVSDTGCGMDAETLRRIFEPFFTTKGVGKGTGLGLSTVYGIVRQSGGNIIAESAPGAGASFRIYLKREEGQAEPVRDGASKPHHGSGCETVLVVEDEEALRTVVDRVLSRAGYRVLATANAAEALTLCQARGPEVHLVLTDVIMPGMNGRELAELIRPLCPSAKILFMSGYTDDAIERLDVLGHDLVRKPFSRETLMQKVRAALDGAQAA